MWDMTLRCYDDDVDMMMYRSDAVCVADDADYALCYDVEGNTSNNGNPEQ